MGPISERVKVQHLVAPHEWHVLTQLSEACLERQCVPAAQCTQYQSFKRALLYKVSDSAERVGVFFLSGAVFP